MLVCPVSRPIRCERIGEDLGKLSREDKEGGAKLNKVMGEQGI